MDLKQAVSRHCAILLLACLPSVAFGFAFTTVDSTGKLLFNQTTGTPVTWVFPSLRVLVGFGPFPPGFVPINGSASWNANAFSALAEWSAVPGSAFTFTGVEQSADLCALGDGQASSGFAADNCGLSFGDAVAVTRILYQVSGSTAVITDADLIVNSTLNWDAYDGPLQVDGGGNPILDFRRVVLHEYGHMVGLAHPDVAGQIVVAIMNSTFAPGGDIDRLTVDDQNGAIALYRAPQNGGGGSSAFDPALLGLLLLLLILRMRNSRWIRNAARHAARGRSRPWGRSRW